MKRSGPAIAWSCVVDDTPEIWASLVPWIASLVECAEADPARIHIHHVCPLRGDVAEITAALDIRTVEVKPFDIRYPHTNKIRQFATEFGDAELIVLSDVDMAFAAPPPFAEIRSPVSGKLVDQPNPPPRRLKAVFAAAGERPPEFHGSTYRKVGGPRVAFETMAGNFNGGLYVLRRDMLKPLGVAWTSWANWLIARPGLLGDWQRFLDQVSFCLAVHDLAIELGTLEQKWNFPLHLGLEREGTEPVALHHHCLFGSDRRLPRTSAPWLDPSIDRVNAAIDVFRKKHIENS